MPGALLALLLAAPMADPKPPLDAFEVAQTTKFLGFAVRDFPKPQGPEKFDELPANAPAR